MIEINQHFIKRECRERRGIGGGEVGGEGVNFEFK